MRINYDSLISVVSEERIANEIANLRISKSNTELHEIATTLVDTLRETAKCKDRFVRRQVMGDLVKVHQVLKSTISNHSYSQDLHDLVKSLSIIYVVYFLTSQSEVN